MASSSPPAALGFVIILAFPIFFVAMWSFVSVLIAMISGWRGMAATLRCPEGVAGAALPSGWLIRVGGASYKGVLHFEACPQGLIARVSWLFPFHPPLLLPWSSVRVVRTDGVFHAGELQVAGGATFRLNSDAFNAIEGAIAHANTAAAWGTRR